MITTLGDDPIGLSLGMASIALDKVRECEATVSRLAEQMGPSHGCQSRSWRPWAVEDLLLRSEAMRTLAVEWDRFEWWMSRAEDWARIAAACITRKGGAHEEINWSGAHGTGTNREAFAGW